MNDSRSQMKCLAIIPARGGSCGVPRKNIRMLAGKPAINWTIETALASDVLDRVIVSTDDLEIAGIAQAAGAEAPFLRPADLAADNTTDLPVYEHALTWLAEYEAYIPDIVVWLRPTSPLRKTDDVEAAVQLLIDTRADWVRSICAVEHHPYWMMRLDGERLTSFVESIDIRDYMRRQLLPPAYRLNGAVEVAWRETVQEKHLQYTGDVCGYVMPAERSIDLDTEFELFLIEALLMRNAQ